MFIFHSRYHSNCEYTIRHLFEVQQPLCTNVAYTGSVYWVYTAPTNRAAGLTFGTSGSEGIGTATAFYRDRTIPDSL